MASVRRGNIIGEARERKDIGIEGEKSKWGRKIVHLDSK